ncbi:MAG: hypothetical protein ACUVTD_08385 [Nitrososphaerales archaeon]
MKEAKSMRVKTTNELPTLYRKVLEKFEEYSVNKKLRFRQAKHILSWLFHIPKNDCWKILKELESFGVITIVPNHFIKLNLANAEFFFQNCKRATSSKCKLYTAV